MKNYLNKKSLTATCFGIWLAMNATPLSAANSLDSVMDGIYSNMTSPDIYNSQRRGVLVGGSYVARIPTRSINLISFDPPRLNAGCGGIDMYLGGFSMINSKQIVETLRQIGQNAVGLLFQLGLKAVNDQLSGMLSNWSKKLEDINSMLKNTCQAANKVVSLMNPKESAATFASMKGGLMKTITGGFSDTAEMEQQKQLNPSALTPNASGTLTGNDLKLAESNPNLGNIVWRAAVNSGVTAKISSSTSPVAATSEPELAMLLMNVVGTLIYSGKDLSATSGCKTGDNVTCVNDAEPYAAYIHPQDLIDPQDKTIKACAGSIASNNKEFGCQTLEDRKLSTYFKGTRYIINDKLYGKRTNQVLTPSDIKAAISAKQGIIGKVLSNQTLTTAELQFLNSIPAPLYAYLKAVQNSPEAIAMISSRVTPMIENYFATNIAQSFYESGSEMFSGKNIKVEEPAFVKERLAIFKQEMNALTPDPKDRIKEENELRTFVRDTVASLPKNVRFQVNPAMSVGSNN